MSVLGPLEVRGPTGPMSLRPAQRRVLGILALSPTQSIGRDALIERFWSGEPPATARAALLTHISGVRRQLGGKVIETRGRGYALGTDVDVDRFHFEAAAELCDSAMSNGDHDAAVAAADDALGLVRGEPYSDLADDDFAQPDIAALGELRLRLLEQRAEARLARGEEASVCNELEALVVTHPFRERLWEHLIVARHRLGRHAEAVHAFREVGARLGEAGLEPTVRFRDLESLVLRHDDSLLPLPVQVGFPTARTSFVGRDRDRIELSNRMDSARLVTVVGAGGCGKTRLVAEVVFASGEPATFVDLTTISDPTFVVGAVTQALQIPPEETSTETGRVPGERIAKMLDRQHRLLVLDNCEHLIDACARLVDGLLSFDGDVRILATSRTPLGVYGEQVYRLAHLDTSDSADADAVRLFLDRARAVRSDFRPDDDDLSAAVQICRHLDGLPLAIELAAARAGHLPPQAIAGRLDDRMRLLVDDRRTATRHRSLVAALDWSHGLLDEPARTLLRRLAVFTGPFSLDVVERVCTDDRVPASSVVDVLGALVDASMVVDDRTMQWARYRLLETVRVYAADRLDEAGEAQTMRTRHAHGYLQWLESEPWGVGVFDDGLVAAQMEDLGNLRHALRWLRESGERELVGQMAARMDRLWSPAVGLGAEGRQWLDWALEEEAALTRTTRAGCWTTRSVASTMLNSAEQEDDADRAVEIGEPLDGYVCEALGVRALATASRAAAGEEGADVVALDRIDELLVVAEAFEGTGWPSYAHIYGGLVAVVLGDLVQAATHYDKAMTSTELPSTLSGLLAREVGTVRYLLGDHHGALDAVEQLWTVRPTSLTRPERIAVRSMPEAALGRSTAAADHLRRALIVAEQRDVLLEVNVCMICAAAVAFELGKPVEAARLLGASVSVLGARDRDFRFRFRSPSAYALYAFVRDRLRERTDPEIHAARTAGRQLSDAAALDLVRSFADSLGDADR